MYIKINFHKTNEEKKGCFTSFQYNQISCEGWYYYIHFFNKILNFVQPKVKFIKQKNV